MEPYAVIKFVHVLAAIVAVGFNASYATWLARAAPEPQHLGHVLATIGVVDNVANAFYALLLVTGLGMVLVGSIPLTTFWIAAALVLYVLAIFVGIVLFAPVARGQREALAKSGPQSAEYHNYERRGRTLGIAVSVIVLFIVFLMVAKPNPFA